MRLTGDAGSWGQEAATAARFPGPPEICGSGRAKQFVASVRAVARWAAAVEHAGPHDGGDGDESEGSESDGDGRGDRGRGGGEGVAATKRGVDWLVLMDPGTRLLAPVTRPPTGDANGADDQHWTRALHPNLLSKAAEVSGVEPQYAHSGLCGGAALRVRSLVGGRSPRLDALKPLDDRVDWWHDVALATFFAFNGKVTRPWPDLRENGGGGAHYSHHTHFTRLKSSVFFFIVRYEEITSVHL